MGGEIWCRRRDLKSQERKPGSCSHYGASPLVPSLRSGHPMKGEHPLQNPQFESRPKFPASA